MDYGIAMVFPKERASGGWKRGRDGEKGTGGRWLYLFGSDIRMGLGVGKRGSQNCDGDCRLWCDILSSANWNIIEL